MIAGMIGELARGGRRFRVGTETAQRRVMPTRETTIDATLLAVAVLCFATLSAIAIAGA